MKEVWLYPNRRILLMAMMPVAFLSGLSLVALVTVDSSWIKILGIGGLGFTLALAVGLIQQIRRPRIAYCQGEVLFYLRAGDPIAVPLRVVEAFFLGQGEARLPIRPNGDAETINLVARLSQQEPQWQHLEVKQALGRWCDGYVTIRGTWCEPLTGKVICRLNQRLGELNRKEHQFDGISEQP